MSARVTLTRSEDMASIEFESEKANSFSKQMLADLAQLISKVHLEVKAIVIRSSGEKTFSAGASFEEFEKIANVEQAEQYFSGFLNVIEAIRNSSAPVICRVQGKAVGGAVGLIAACDYVFAHNSAAVKLSELELGIGPFTISPAVERKIGIARFSEMLLDCSWKSSQWAETSGLFSRVFTTIEDLDRELIEFVAKLSKQSKNTLAKNRKLLWNNTDHWPEQMKQSVKIVSELLLKSKA